jgi:hypothetical protein
MAYSQKKVDAHAALDAAIELMTAAYDEDNEEKNEGQILNGWLLITTSVRCFTEDETKDPTCDEQGMQSIEGAYSKRGQNPLLSLALAHEYIRHYNDAQQ